MVHSRAEYTAVGAEAQRDDGERYTSLHVADQASSGDSRTQKISSGASQTRDTR